MTILLSCECGKKLRAREEWRGTKVKCPACGTIMLIPENPPPETRSRSPSPSKPKPATVTQKNGESNLPRVTKSAPPPPAPPRKPPAKVAEPEEETGDVDEPRV